MPTLAANPGPLLPSRVPPPRTLRAMRRASRFSRAKAHPLAHGYCGVDGLGIAPPGPPAPGAAAAGLGFALTTSTSKIKAEFAGMFGRGAGP